MICWANWQLLRTQCSKNSCSMSNHHGPGFRVHAKAGPYCFAFPSNRLLCGYLHKGSKSRTEGVMIYSDYLRFVAGRGSGSRMVW